MSWVIPAASAAHSTSRTIRRPSPPPRSSRTTTTDRSIADCPNLCSAAPATIWLPSSATTNCGRAVARSLVGRSALSSSARIVGMSLAKAGRVSATRLTLSRGYPGAAARCTTGRSSQLLGFPSNLVRPVPGTPARGQKRLPRHTLRIFDFIHRPVGTLDLRIHLLELGPVLELDPPVLGSRLCTAMADGKIHARFLENPPGVSGLLRGGHGGKELRLETDGFLDIIDGHMNVRTLHADFLSVALPAIGLQFASQASSARLQQFSVRKPTKPFMCARLGL